MLRLRCQIETQVMSSRPKEWEVKEWGQEEERETKIVNGAIDVLDIQFYASGREDRVYIGFKSGGVITIVASLEAFEHELTRMGL